MSLLSEKEILGDRYEIISKLGEGAMGVVFEAIDLVSGQKCAVKILKDPNMSEARHKRFDEEGRCIALLDSPYIVKFYEIGVNPKGTRFVVMEKLEGECLSDLIQKRKLSEIEGIYVILKVLEALAVVHRANLVHRDLKPANIFICHKTSNRGNVKLLDFGIVKDLSTDLHITATNIWVGTPKYMSPEAFDPKQSFCKESDLYAVGILLYLFVSGSFPYELDDASIPKHLQKMPPAVKISWLHLHGVPKALKHPLNPLIQKLLSKSPQHRGSIKDAIEIIQKQYPYLPDEIDLFSETREQDLNFDQTESHRVDGSYFDQIDQALASQKKEVIQKHKTVLVKEHDIQELKKNIIEHQSLKKNENNGIIKKITHHIQNIFGFFKSKPLIDQVDQTLEVNHQHMDQKQKSNHYLQQKKPTPKNLQNNQDFKNTIVLSDEEKERVFANIKHHDQEDQSQKKTIPMSKSQIFKNISFEDFIGDPSIDQDEDMIDLDDQDQQILDEYIEEELTIAQNPEQSELFIKSLHELLSQKN